MLIVDHSKQISVVSFPTIALDIKTKVLSLHGLLGTNCLSAVPIKVLGNTIKDLLTFAIVEEDATGLRATPDHASRADADVDLHPSPGSTLVQIPMVLPLVGKYGIIQGKLSDDEVKASIIVCHDLATSWS